MVMRWMPSRVASRCPSVPHLLLLADTSQSPRGAGLGVAGGAAVFFAAGVLEPLDVQADAVLIFVSIGIVGPKKEFTLKGKTRRRKK